MELEIHVIVKTIKNNIVVGEWRQKCEKFMEELAMKILLN